MNYLKNLFKGRLSLGNFWVGFLLPVIIFLPVGLIEEKEKIYNSIILNLIGGTLFITYFIYFFSIIIRRLHDNSKSGWFLLWSFVPLAQIYVLVLLFYVGSEKTTNQFGPVPNNKISLKKVFTLKD